ncbi:MAG TPA: YggT family protein [Patescibacteria group bacterium]|nr:YggT family protein [Patescibacteria group bacterium]
MGDIVSKKTTITVGGQKADSSQSANYIIYYIFGVVEILLVFRLILKLTGANPGSGFVSFIYSLTQLFVLPFSGIFRGATTQGNVVTAILEPSTLVALVVYAVLAWGITQLVEIMSGKKQE